MLSKPSVSLFAVLLAWAGMAAHAAADPAMTSSAATVDGAAAAPVALPPIPERAAQQYTQALSLMKAGRLIDAELELKQLTLAYPELPGPQINLGLLLARSARLPEAQAAFKAAIATNSNSAVALTELGLVERRLGKFADAEQDYQRAIAADPGYAPARLNLGVLYDLYLNEPQKALDQFEQYLALAGAHKQVSGWAAELRKRLGVSAPAPAAAPAALAAPAASPAAPAQESTP